MEQRYFQWLAGDRRGEILVFNDIIEEDGIQYLTFKDGSRINSEFVAEINQKSVDGKLMAEIENPRNAWGFKELSSPDDKPRIEQDWESQTKYEVPTADELAHADLTGQSGVVKPVPKKKKIELIPPRPTKNKFGKLATSDDMSEKYNDTITTQPKVEQTTPQKSTGSSDDPVYIMMEKAKKIDTEVDMSLTISLPSKHLFDVVRDSFDDGDSKALEYIIENIDITEIKEALKAGIKAMYGPNEDPEDNKMTEENVAVWTGEDNIENNQKSYASGLFEPDTVQEPVVRDARPEEAEKDLVTALKQKAEKINNEDE
jgi:hypothetical protein